MNMPILDELANELRSVSPEDITLAIANMPPYHSQECLGVIRNPDAIQLHALAIRLEARAEEMEFQAKYRTADQDGKMALFSHAVRNKELAEIARAMFWIQAADDLDLRADFDPDHKSAKIYRDGENLVIVSECEIGIAALSGPEPPPEIKRKIREWVMRRMRGE
jgi:hypothetical protein